MQKKTLVAAMVLALGTTALVPVQMPLLAQAATPKADKAYYDLYDAIIGGVDLDALSRKGSGEIFDAIVQSDPKFARMASSKEGIRDRFIAMCMPYFGLWMPRSLKIARERSVVALMPVLTPAEARELAQFYASPLGRKVISSVAGNITFSSQLEAGMQGGNFHDKQAAGADQRAGLEGGLDTLMASLSEEEKRELLAFGHKPVFQKIGAMNKALASVAIPTMDEISTPAEREEFGSRLQQFMAAEFGR